MNIEEFVQKLDRYEKTGHGYRARCPCHEGKSLSLSIAEGDDGRILLHCFGGCAAVEVVKSMGLELGDLMPPREDGPDWKGRRQLLNDRELFNTIRDLTFPLAIVATAAEDIRVGRPKSERDMETLRVAIAKIDAAREKLREFLTHPRNRNDRPFRGVPVTRREA